MPIQEAAHEQGRSVVIVRMGLLQQRADIDNQKFRSSWRGRHGELAAKLPGLRRYHQNHVVDRQQRGITYARSSVELDGFSELWFDDLPSMHAAFANEKQVRDLAEDEAGFIGEIKLITAIQHVVIPTPVGVPLIKRMTTLRRRPDISAEKFAEEWFDVHSMLVKRLPQVEGYTQNLIFDRSLGRGKPATYADVPIDGIVELWFTDANSLNAGFTSDAGKTLMMHATEFIADMSTFLVETHEVV
jgi:uncharacterized protein (TIGR02118 family)